MNQGLFISIHVYVMNSNRGHNTVAEEGLIKACEGLEADTFVLKSDECISDAWRK